MNKTTTKRVALSGQPCGEPLYENGRYVARCCQVWGTEHSHHDCTAKEAVQRGLATDAKGGAQ